MNDDFKTLGIANALLVVAVLIIIGIIFLPW